MKEIPELPSFKDVLDDAGLMMEVYNALLIAHSRELNKMKESHLKAMQETYDRLTERESI